MYVIISNLINNICTLETRKLITPDEFYKISLVDKDLIIKSYTDIAVINIFVSTFGIHSIVGDVDLYETLILRYQEYYIRKVVEYLQKSSIDKIKYDSRIIETKLEYGYQHYKLVDEIENLLEIEYSIKNLRNSTLINDLKSLVSSYIFDPLYTSTSYIPLYLSKKIYVKISTQFFISSDYSISVYNLKNRFEDCEDQQHVNSILKYIKDLKLNDDDMVYIKGINCL